MLRKFLVIVFTLFLLQTAYLVLDGLHDVVRPADAILVLGSKVKSGGMVSNTLKGRLDQGYALYRSGFSQRIIVSGGLGKEGYCEAKVMADYLERLGVPQRHILVDENGRNTWQSALNFKGMNFRSVILVSSYWHLTRAKLAFRRLGVPEVYASHARMRPQLRELYSIPREVIAFYFYLIRKAAAV
jgi:uncharacterized SAM-binding protein YcdF (DUF218 family)